MKIKLATWNVLADCYVKGQVGGQDSRGEWNSRSELMRATLVEAMSSVDVFCLQEVDHFDDFYSELFHSFGFCTIYMQRPTKNDGCLIAYRSDKFLVKHTQLINLDQLSHLDRQLQRTGRSKFAKQNVSAMAILEEIESRKRFLVATCHLHWNPNLPEVKFAQAYYVVDRISSFRECHKNVPVVFTGDFNSLPRDEVYRFIASPASVKATSFGSIELALASQIESSVYTYGPKTKFLCDSSLSRLCRWMRILGVDVAQDSWDLRADNGNGNNGNGNGKPMLDVSSPMVSPRMMMSPHSTNVSTKSTKSMVEHFKKQTIAAFFQRARSEKRVILTTSKGLLQRSTCPPSYFVKPGKLEDALVTFHRRTSSLFPVM